MTLLTEITVDQRDAAWLAEATSFSACIFAGRAHIRGDYRTLAEAGAVAAYLNRQATNARKAIVYAITAEGHATMVPQAMWEQALAEGLVAEDAAADQKKALAASARLDQSPAAKTARAILSVGNRRY